MALSKNNLETTTLLYLIVHDPATQNFDEKYLELNGLLKNGEPNKFMYENLDMK